MNVQTRFALALLAVTLPAISLLVASPATALAQYDARVRQVDEYVRAAADLGFSGTVLVAHGDQVLLHQGYGLADREREIPVTTRTLFDVGSITKDLTRSAVLLLWERDKISLDDTLTEFFDGVPDDKAGITIEQLLRHSAGLDEYHDTEGDFEPMTREEAIATILGQRLRFEPGSDSAYSNSGYTMLAAIIEIVSGRPYAEFLRENIWQPLGMEQTGFYHDPRWDPDHVAHGYDGRLGPGRSRSPADWPETSWAMVGNGGMVTSAQELFAWLVASNRGEIVPATTLDHFQGPGTGQGLVRRDFFFAGGSDFGFIAAVVGNAERDTMVIVTGNTGGRYNAERMAGQIDRILAGEEPTPLEQITARRDEGMIPPAGSWGLPDSEAGRALSALLDMTAAGTEQAVRDFIRDWMTDEFREGHPMEDHVGILRQLQALVPDPELLGAERTGEFSARMSIGSQSTGERIRISIDLEESPPNRISGMQIGD